MYACDIPGVSRRGFLHHAGMAAAGLAALPAAGAKSPAASEWHEAAFYDAMGQGTVQCTLCPWQCVVPAGKPGRCRVRVNRDGKLYTLVYGRPVAMHNDPIEKKPFFHVYPGSRSFSIATVGCNMVCKFCQNWEISQADPHEAVPPFVPPGDIVTRATAKRSKTVAFTYSEPTVFYDYMLDCARAAHEAGIGCVAVSNGFISRRPLRKLLPYLTAYKVDFKAFSQQFYGETCAGRLAPVLDTLETLKDEGIWFEIVVLVIPGLNDDPDEIKRMSAWITENLGPDVPLHFTRFHPAYKIRNLPPTPPQTLYAARAAAMAEGCHFVYTGNMPGGEGENTYCPSCKSTVINRYGHLVMKLDLKSGACVKCGAVIPGVWGE